MSESPDTNLRDEIEDAILDACSESFVDDPFGDLRYKATEKLVALFEVRLRKAQAEAWEQGHQWTSLDLEDGPIPNPYREESS